MMNNREGVYSFLSKFHSSINKLSVINISTSFCIDDVTVEVFIVTTQSDLVPGIFFLVTILNSLQAEGWGMLSTYDSWQEEKTGG